MVSDRRWTGQGWDKSPCSNALKGGVIALRPLEPRCCLHLDVIMLHA
jgi:hypothetical protein